MVVTMGGGGSYGGEVVVGEIGCGEGLMWLRWRGRKKEREKVC
jgi:hypothetical protein